MNTPLRILVVLPLYGGSLPIGRYCAQALRDLGHLVEEFDERVVTISKGRVVGDTKGSFGKNTGKEG